MRATLMVGVMLVGALAGVGCQMKQSNQEVNSRDQQSGNMKDKSDPATAGIGSAGDKPTDQTGTTQRKAGETSVPNP